MNARLHSNHVARALLGALVAVALAGCGSGSGAPLPGVSTYIDAPTSTPEPTTPAPTATSTLDPDAQFGPDGTHYPSDTPDLRQGLDGFHVVEVEASAEAIRGALDALTPAEIDAGSVIRVAPGDIADMGALDGYANTQQKKVLITARDGFASVTGSKGWRFTDVTGIAVMRFQLAVLDVKGARHSSFGWIRLTDNYLGAAGSHGVPVDDVEFIEVVEPDSTVKSSDSSQVKAYPPQSLSNVLIEGSYFAPSFYEDGNYGRGNPRPHTDTLQIEGDGITGGIVIRDTAVFASNNSALIIGGVPGISFEHVLVAGGDVRTLRYPFATGGAGARGARQGPGSGSAIQGTGGGDVTATDSTFIGSLQPVWSSVTNTTTNLESAVARNAGFTLDLGLDLWTTADLDAVSTTPTPEYLTSIWD